MNGIEDIDFLKAFQANLIEYDNRTPYDEGEASGGCSIDKTHR